MNLRPTDPPNLPVRPPFEAVESKPSRRFEFVRIAVLLVLAILLLGTISLISQAFALVVLAFGGLVILQYLLWGWWVKLLLQRGSDRDSDSS